MKNFICAVLLCVFCHMVPSEGKTASPEVHVYTRNMSRWGEENKLICHAANFYPPDISLELLQNDQVISSNQSDLAFDGEWNYYLTRFATIVPAKGDRFACRVIHNGKGSMYNWEPDE